MKKLTVIGHTDKVMRKVSNTTALTDQALWYAVAKVIKSDTMELRAQYVTELIEAIAQPEFHNSLDYPEVVSEVTTDKTYEFNAGDGMVFHENIYKTDKEYCAVCGKGLGKNPVHVEVHNGGDLVEFGKGIQDSGYMGCWAIGSTCAHKFSPELIGNVETITS